MECCNSKEEALATPDEELTLDEIIRYSKYDEYYIFHTGYTYRGYLEAKKRGEV